MRELKYRSDIDGLRGYAVLFVLFYHLDFSFFQGGFVGVDIFFVISGFLISGLIHKEVLHTDSFSFLKFYKRRFWRLFPALLVTVCFSLLGSVLLFSPLLLERVGKSSFFSLTYLSNFFFWTESHYFDAGSEFKPLLHTWSLAIEEQFYILWPFLLLALVYIKRNALRIAILILLILGGLYLNLLFQDGLLLRSSWFPFELASNFSNGKSTVFYLLPFRIYEFSLGAILVFIDKPAFKTKLLDEVFGLLGMLLIVFSVLTIKPSALYPGYQALYPCLGAALLLFGGNRSRTVKKVMSNSLAVHLGSLSYSLYLIHWPIIVFWKYYSFEKLSAMDSIAVIVVSYALAYLLHAYVEQPFRFKRSQQSDAKTPASKVAVFALLVLSAVSIVSSYCIVSSNGLPSRLSQSNLRLSSRYLKQNDIPSLAVDGLPGVKPWTHAIAIEASSKPSARVLVIGDSYAQHLRGMAKYLSDKYNLSFTFYTFSSCPPLFGVHKIFGSRTSIGIDKAQQVACRRQIEFWEDHVRSKPYDYVFLAARWNWHFEPRKYLGSTIRGDLLVSSENPKFTVEDSKRVFKEHLDSTIKAVHSSGARAVVFGQINPYGHKVEGCYNYPRYLISDDRVAERCGFISRDDAVKRSSFSDESIRAITARNDALSVVLTDYFCPESEVNCLDSVGGIRLREDESHLSVFGSEFVGKMWERSPSFPFLQ